MSNIDYTIIKWKAEVEDVTIELIERGVPPYEAAQQATRIVTQRRRKKHADKSGG